jgi:hypothetical protein
VTYSVALLADVYATLSAHLLRSDGQEDVCFALWHPSTASRRFSALLVEPLLPLPGERNVHGNASFEGRFLERALAEACRTRTGIALLHSHPGGRGWQGMSLDDVAAESGCAAQALAATGLPLVGLTIAGDGSLSSRFWPRVGARAYERRDSISVRVLGDQLKVMFNDALRPVPGANKRLTRTTSAWGVDVQADLARLHIGVVGAGSVGAIVSEALVRTGVERVTIIDFDNVEEHNLDRLLHATEQDVGRSKVETLAHALRRSATSPTADVEPLTWSVTEPEGLQAALDCDVLFSCVDRPWPRAVLNLVAYSHFIPVIDGGIRVQARPEGALVRADWRAHIAAPGRRCLECLGQYDPGQVQMERDGMLDDPRYIEGLPHEHPLRARENVFAFSLAAASLEVLQFLSMVVAPAGVANIGAQTYHFVTGTVDRDTRTCNAHCPYAHELLGAGDYAPVRVTGDHKAARAARSSRNVSPKSATDFGEAAKLRLLRIFDRRQKPRRGRAE